MSYENTYILYRDTEIIKIIENKLSIQEINFCKKSVSQNVIPSFLTPLIKEYASNRPNITFCLATKMSSINYVLYPYESLNNNIDFVELGDNGDPVNLTKEAYNALLELVEDITEMSIIDFTDGLFNYIDTNPI